MRLPDPWESAAAPGCAVRRPARRPSAQPHPARANGRACRRRAGRRPGPARRTVPSCAVRPVPGHPGTGSEEHRGSEPASGKSHQGGRHHGPDRPRLVHGIANANLAEMVVDDINAAVRGTGLRPAPLLHRHPQRRRRGVISPTPREQAGTPRDQTASRAVRTLGNGTFRGRRPVLFASALG